MCTSENIIVQLGDFISKQPNLDLPIPTEKAETWLLTTFLDDSLRISRGDQGSIFVLTRESFEPIGSALPTSSGAATGMMQSREPNRTTVEGLASDVRNRVQTAAKDAQQEGERLAQRVQGAMQDPAQALRDASRTADDNVQKAVAAGEDFAEDSAQALKDASSSIDKNVQQVVDMGERIADDPAGEARSAIRRGDAAVKDAADDLASNRDVQSFGARDASQVKRSSQQAQRAATNLVDQIKEVADDVNEVSKDAIDKANSSAKGRGDRPKSK
jgi:ElaB/YqjD/DUF883 family membrane-anchored ribosome-binding protein